MVGVTEEEEEEADEFLKGTAEEEKKITWLNCYYNNNYLQS